MAGDVKINRPEKGGRGSRTLVSTFLDVNLRRDWRGPYWRGEERTVVEMSEARVDQESATTKRLVASEAGK